MVKCQETSCFSHLSRRYFVNFFSSFKSFPIKFHLFTSRDRRCKESNVCIAIAFFCSCRRFCMKYILFYRVGIFWIGLCFGSWFCSCSAFNWHQANGEWLKCPTVVLQVESSFTICYSNNKLTFPVSSIPLITLLPLSWAIRWIFNAVIPNSGINYWWAM